MSTNANDMEIKEIERRIAGKREELERYKKSLESMRDDPDMMADAGGRDAGRLNRTQDEIKQLEELLSLQTE